MIRKFALVVVGLSLFMTRPILAQQQEPDWDKVQIRVHKLSGNMYMLESQGQPDNVGIGNIGVFVGDDGLVLVDSMLVELGPKINAALKTISDKPVKYLLNTHSHGDHTGGNVNFGKTATIIAQDNLRTKMQKVSDRRITNLALSLPVITFSNELTLHMNGGDVHAVYFPLGHTDGDTVVLFPQGNAVHMGDDFVNYSPPHYPLIDTDGTGGFQGQIAAAEYVLAHMPADVKVIPGHGDLATRDDLTKDLAVLKGTSAAVQAGIDQGKSLEQLKQEKVLEKWDYLVSVRPVTADVYLQRLYNDLMRAKSGGTR
jgi:cyclase